MKNYLVLNSLLSRLEKGIKTVEVIVPALHQSSKIKKYVEDALDIELPIDSKIEVDNQGVNFIINDDFYTEKDLSKYQFTDVHKDFEENNIQHTIGFRIYFREID